MIGTEPMADRHDTHSAAPRWLKLLVAAMGVLIVCGTVGIIVAALQYPERAEFPEHSVVNLPPGAEIREVRLQDGQIVVHAVIENSIVTTTGSAVIVMIGVCSGSFGGRFAQAARSITMLLR